MPARRTLYPPVEPHLTSYLPVSEGHEVYYEVCGNPAGTPVVFVHGGPGGGGLTTRKDLRFFDPSAYRIVLFHQRGCGNSRPHSSLEANTTWHLVEDMERLRTHLGIGRWVVFGGSWGSTLSLAYAERHPDRVRALVIRGIWLARPEEIRWYYQEGANFLFPDAWEVFVEAIPLAERHDLMAAYHRRLTGDDAAVREKAVHAWCAWEALTLKLIPEAPEEVERYASGKHADALARLECHYYINGAFLDPPNQLLAEIEKVRSIPAVIVQGRYDVICPTTAAWDLHRRWPEAEFHIVPDAGHVAHEPGITDRLITATDSIRGVK